MKTSKIILVSYLSLWGLFFLSFIITTEPEVIIHPEIAIQVEETSPIRYIKVERGGKIKVATSDTLRIEYEYYKDSVEVENPLIISGDTLYVKYWERFPLKRYKKITLYTDTIRLVESDGGNVIFGLNQDSLMLRGYNEAYFKMDDRNEINYINLQLNDHSKANFNSGNIKKLDAHVRRNSTLYTYDYVENIIVTGRYDATIRLHGAGKLYSDCDTTSSLAVADYP